MNQETNPEITIIGLWHQGVVAAACLADLGFNITAADCDKEKINNLSKGITPIFEPGLEELVKKGLKSGRLKFVSDLSLAVSEKEFIFLMFDTKVDEDDATDLSEIFFAIEGIANSLKNDSLIYNTSQVPVGTSDQLLKIIKNKNSKINLSIVYSPENLRLGQALNLFLEPALPVIGSDEIEALDRIENLLKPLNTNWLRVNLKTAEMCKHALNSFLATTISFANELGNICDLVGADGYEIAKALRLEPRISPKAMLRPGMGFSGGTLARDVQTLRKIGDKSGIETYLLDGLWETNIYQNKYVIRTLFEIFKDINNKKVTILGITYKPGTSTLRRSVALETIKYLNSQGAEIKVHDPKADKKELYNYSGFVFKENISHAIDDAEAVVIMTGWEEYKNIDWKFYKDKLSNPIIIDCNNMLDNEKLICLGYKYFCIGRGLNLNK